LYLESLRLAILANRILYATDTKVICAKTEVAGTGKENFIFHTSFLAFLFFQHFFIHLPDLILGITIVIWLGIVAKRLNLTDSIEERR
jgi:hypothetical protein